MWSSSKFRQEFLYFMIYLDNHRATRPSSKVVEAMQKEMWIDPSAPYYKDAGVICELEKGLQNIYDLTGASKDSTFVVTGGEWDAARQVFNKVLQDVFYQSGKNFLLAPITENAPIREAMEALEGVGCVAKYLPVNEKGELTVSILEKHFTPKAGVLALSWVNPLTGVIQPVEEIAAFCKERGVLLYVQGSEMFAKLFMRLDELAIDFFSFSADLFHGPKGVGGLFLKEKKNSFEVKNLPGLMGMGIAAGEVLDFMCGMSTETAYLRSVFEEGLVERVPGVQFFGREGKRLPNTSCFAAPGIHAELLTFLLSQKGLLLSFGGGRVQKLEHLLTATGVMPFLAKSAVSVALSMDTSEREIKQAVTIIAETVSELGKGVL